jgi:hypothetical protein
MKAQPTTDTAPILDRIASLDERIARKVRLVGNYHASVVEYLALGEVPYEAIAGKLLRAAQIARSLEHLREQREDLQALLQEL